MQLSEVIQKIFGNHCIHYFTFLLNEFIFKYFFIPQFFKCAFNQSHSLKLFVGY